MSASAGLATAYLTRPISRVLQGSSVVFRHTWLKFSFPLLAFSAGFIVFKQMSARLFGGRKVNFERATGELDLEERFRLANQEIEGEYGDRRIKVRRMGKDKSDMVWQYSKIHGLENIANVDNETLQTIGNDPVALQKAINEAEPVFEYYSSREELIESTKKSLDEYKKEIDKLNLSSSDRKRLLALPYYQARRVQIMEPQKGTWQREQFKELFGVDWDQYKDLAVDNEKKITEFDYENFFPAEMLKHIDTDSEEFKNKVRWMSLTQKTKYEQHQENKANYLQHMPVLCKLTEDEGKAYFHTLMNK